MVVKAFWVVLVAAMALATQLSLVTPSVEESLVAPSVEESLAAPVTRLIPEAPVLPESQVVQPVPFHRSWGHPTHQGLVETLHLEPEF